MSSQHEEDEEFYSDDEVIDENAENPLLAFKRKQYDSSKIESKFEESGPSDEEIEEDEEEGEEGREKLEEEEEDDDEEEVELAEEGVAEEEKKVESPPPRESIKTQNNKNLYQDRKNTKDPSFCPKGLFFEHDARSGEPATNDKVYKKNFDRSEVEDKWCHDRFLVDDEPTQKRRRPRNYNNQNSKRNNHNHITVQRHNHITVERHNHKTAERHTSKVPLKIVENSHEIQGKQQMEEEQEELSHIQGKKSFYPRPAANNFAPSSGVYNSQKRNNNSGGGYYNSPKHNSNQDDNGNWMSENNNQYILSGDSYPSGKQPIQTPSNVHIPSVPSSSLKPTPVKQGNLVVYNYPSTSKVVPSFSSFNPSVNHSVKPVLAEVVPRSFVPEKKPAPVARVKKALEFGQKPLES